MRFVLVIIGIFIFCSTAFSADKITAIIQFQNNSSVLSEEGKINLESLINENSNSKIEKIDIEGFCATSQNLSLNGQLSIDRATTVYRYLNSVYPDNGNYELRTAQATDSDNLDEDRCVQVSIYVLQINVPKPKGDISMALFPEDFESELKAISEQKQEESFIPTEIVANMHFDIEDIFFYGNSARYKSTSEESLDELLSFMRYNPRVKIQLEGHVNGKMGKAYYRKASGTNPEGKSYESALDLSEARAKSVKKFLVDNGIDKKRIVAIGKGNKDPLYKRPKNQKENSANRRIQVVILEN